MTQASVPMGYIQPVWYLASHPVVVAVVVVVVVVVVVGVVGVVVVVVGVVVTATSGPVRTP